MTCTHQGCRIRQICLPIPPTLRTEGAGLVCTPRNSETGAETLKTCPRTGFTLQTRPMAFDTSPSPRPKTRHFSLFAFCPGGGVEAEV